MTGENPPGKPVEGLEKTGIGGVGQVQDQLEPAELLEQIAPGGGQWAIAARTKRVGALAIMRQAGGAEPLVEPPLGLAGRDDRVAPLHAQDDAQWSGCRVPGIGCREQMC